MRRSVFVCVLYQMLQHLFLCSDLIWFDESHSATLEADKIISQFVVDKKWKFRLFINYSIERKVNLQLIWLF